MRCIGRILLGGALSGMIAFGAAQAQSQPQPQPQPQGDASFFDQFFAQDAPSPPPPQTPPQTAPVAVLKGGVNSLLYGSGDIEKIRRALDIYRRNQLEKQAEVTPPPTSEEEDFLSKLAADLAHSGKKAEIVSPYGLPSFYLESMMRYSDRNWVVWMDNRKFSGEAPRQGDLEVVAVHPGGVVFRWYPRQIAKVIQAWDGNPDRDARIALNEAEGTVEFRLGMNQSFHAARMQIAEGRTLGAPPPSPSVSAATHASPEAADISGAPQEREGLQGLQNLYKNELGNIVKNAQ